MFWKSNHKTHRTTCRLHFEHLAYTTLFGLVLIYIVNAENGSFITQQDPRNANNDNIKMKVPGQLIFGGLFPMHEKGSNGMNCGALKEQKGIQRLEAMMYAIDLINDDPTLLPNTTIGVHILDTCSRDTYALEQSVDFIRSHMNSLDVTEYMCNNGKNPDIRPVKPVVGVIGAASSQVSIMVANVLRLFKIPQISYASTSQELSDKTRFEYFSRVVPPDTLQAQAMVDIAVELEWKYVSTIADEGNYGEKGIAAFEELAKEHDICIAKAFIIPREITGTTFDDIIRGLFDSTGHAKGVIMFVNEDNTKKLLEAKSKAYENYTSPSHNIHFLASDSWGAKTFPIQDHPEAAHGAITILPKRKVLEGFDNYFLSRNLTNNLRNPWWREFWMQYFHCSLDNITTHGTSECTGNEQLGSDIIDGHPGTRYEQEGLVQFVVDSVLAMSHAVHNIQKDKCEDEIELCYEAVPTKGKELLEYIRNVSFTGSSGGNVRFDRNGDAVAKYNIFQFQRTIQGLYKYVPIGEWVNSLKINLSIAEWPDSKDKPPKSVCSEPCKAGYAQSNKGGSCCWICIKCQQYEYLKDAATCVPCPNGMTGNTNKTKCQNLPVQYMRWDSAWAIIPTAFAVLGIIFTAIFIYIFIRYNQTPIIMASGRELCYILLAGVLMCYSMSIVMLAKPSKITCGLFRLGEGLSLVICYASIFTKTNRISRIFNRGVKAIVKRPSYTSPRSQIVICSTLVSVQLVGVITWLIIESPGSVLVYPTRETVILRCRTSDIAQVISLLYNMVLVFLCTIYAFKTRKIPENFNEAKWIAFSMYSTCIVWLAFIPISVATSSADFRIRITSLSMCTSISGSVILGCLFAPKVYIVLFQPHKNVRQTNSTMLGSTAGKGRTFFGKSGGKAALHKDIMSPSTSTITDSTLINSDLPSDSDGRA